MKNSFKNFILFLFLFNVGINPFAATSYECDLFLKNGSQTQELTANCQINGENGYSSSTGTFVMEATGTQQIPIPADEGVRVAASCDFTLGNLHGNFLMFDSVLYVKSTCENGPLSWIVDERGLSSIIDKNFQLIYEWPK